MFSVSKLQRNSAPCLSCAFLWMWKTLWAVTIEPCRKLHTAFRFCSIAAPYCCCSWQTRSPVSSPLIEDIHAQTLPSAFDSPHQTWRSSSQQVGWAVAPWSSPLQTSVHVSPAGKTSALQTPSLAFLSDLTAYQLLLLPILIPSVRACSVH